MPAGNRARFFRSERREKQLRESGFPRERFGFVQCEVEHMLMFLEPTAKFSRDLFANIFNLGQKFPAGRHTTDAESHPGPHLSIFNSIHHNVYPSSSCLNSQI